MLDLNPDPYAVKYSGNIETNFGYNMSFMNVDIAQINRFLLSFTGNLRQFTIYMGKELIRELGELQLKREIENRFRQFINYRYETYGPGWRGWSDDYLQFMIQHGISQRLLYRTGEMKRALDNVEVFTNKKGEFIQSFYLRKQGVYRNNRDYTFYHQQYGRPPSSFRVFYRRACFKRQVFRRNFMRIETFYTRSRHIPLRTRKILPETKDEMDIVFRDPIVKFFTSPENIRKMKGWFAKAVLEHLQKVGV